MTARTLFRAALTLLAALLTPFAAAAQDAGTVRLQGSVASNCYLVVSLNGAGQALNLVAGHNNLTVGSVGEVCNRGNGFTVSIASSNSGALVSGSGERVPYTIQYDNSGVRSLATPVVLTRSFAKPTVWTRSFRVNVPATPQAIAGDYADSITLTIAAR